MNKNRIAKAMYHIDSLIFDAEHDLKCSTHVIVSARESHDYLKYVLESLEDLEAQVEMIKDTLDDAYTTAKAAERILEAEPKHVPVGLGS